MNTAVVYNVRSATAATKIPNFFASIGIGIAACSRTALNDARSAAINGSNDSLNRSCRYGASAGGRFAAVVNVASSPAADAYTRNSSSGCNTPASA
jgi:hypothetical protein